MTDPPIGGTSPADRTLRVTDWNYGFDRLMQHLRGYPGGEAISGHLAVLLALLERLKDGNDVTIRDAQELVEADVTMDPLDTPPIWWMLCRIVDELPAKMVEWQAEVAAEEARETDEENRRRALLRRISDAVARTNPPPPSHLN